MAVKITILENVILQAKVSIWSSCLHFCSQRLAITIKANVGNQTSLVYKYNDNHFYPIFTGPIYWQEKLQQHTKSLNQTATKMKQCLHQSLNGKNTCSLQMVFSSGPNNQTIIPVHILITINRTNVLFFLQVTNT